MFSSDSSDDEELQRIREAADCDFINDAMYSNGGRLSVHNGDKVVKYESLRPSHKRNFEYDELNLSEGFRNHVAKHLSKYLDKQLEKKLCTVSTTVKKVRGDSKDSGIKLFRSSWTHLSDCDTDSKEGTHKRRKLKKKLIFNNDKNIEEAVVTPEQVLSRQDTEHWTSRGKPIIYKYRRSKHGELMLVEEDRICE